jgi:hypothetical protein
MYFPLLSLKKSISSRKRFEIQVRGVRRGPYEWVLLSLSLISQALTGRLKQTQVWQKQATGLQAFCYPCCAGGQ